MHRSGKDPAYAVIPAFGNSDGRLYSRKSLPNRYQSLLLSGIHPSVYTHPFPPYSSVRFIKKGLPRPLNQIITLAISIMFVHYILLPLSLSSISGVFALPTQTPPDTLPTVDLGYGVYRASYYNVCISPPSIAPPCSWNIQETNDAYVFSNIRFAAPPTGDLRFGLPQPPPVDRSKIHDGSDGGPGCPAALPGTPVLPPGNDSPQSEDCLFLDVIVPRKVLSGELSKVPVAFWYVIHPPM